jgi:uncharacterized membrane protein YbhN (UPF0104 family)
MTTSPPQPHAPQSLRIRIFKFIKWTLLASSLLAAIYVMARERGTLQQALQISPSQLVLIIALLAIYLVIYSYRFLILIEKHCDCRIGLLPWIRMLIVVRLMNNTVPQLGTVYRGVHLKKDFGVSYTDYISANVFFVISDTVFNFAVAALLLMATGNPLSFWGIHASLWLTLALIGLLAAPYIASYIFDRFSFKKVPSKIVQSLSAVARDITQSLRDSRYMLYSNILALSSFVTMALVFHILLQAVSVDLPFATLAVFYALYRVTFHVTITPGNIGIRELAYGLLCAQADVGMSKGILVSAEVRILALLVLLIMGLCLGWRDLRDAWNHTFSKQCSENDVQV